MAENKSKIVIFKTADDKISVDVHFEGELSGLLLPKWLLFLKNRVQL